MFLRDYPETEWIGHNAASADIPILEKIGINIPLEKVLDSIIFHYLVNCHLCKGTGKTTEEMDDKRGRGWMNLGSMLSIYTDLPYYKECRGEMCKPELPCPEHNEIYYNSLDAFGPAIALPKLKMQARLRGVDKLYPMHRELMYVLAQMREYGVKVDRPYVQQLNAEFEAEKKEILDTLPFNPDSPKQVVAYFKDKDVRLENAQEEAIREYIEDEGEENVPDELVLLLDYKELGNGTDRWFKPQYRDPKSGYLKGYLDEDDFIHPSVSIFTSSGRMMSSNPNCFSADTDVLTKRGWVKFPDLQKDDLVAQYSTANDEISFVEPLAHIEQTFIGDLINVKTEDQIDLLMTQDHRCLLRDRKTLQWRFYSASNYPSDLQQFSAGKYVGGSLEFTAAQIAMICALQADGGQTQYGIKFAFSKERKIKRLTWALKAASIKYSRHKDGGFYIGKKNCPEWLWDKKFWGAWLLELTKECLIKLADEVFNWDGLYERRNMYASSDRPNADWIQIVQTLTGRRARIHPYWNGHPNSRICWTVNMAKRPYSLTTNLSVSRVPYMGKVYCVTMPLGTVIVRRNERVAITGNCQNFSKRRRSRKQCECGHAKSEHTGPCTKCTCVSFHGVSMGKKVRRAIIAPDGWYLIRADLGNAEGRTVMWHAGYKELPQDMHSWMVRNIGLTEEEPFSLSMGGAREAAKTAVHSSNYLEGLQLKTPEELRSPRMKKEIEAGARTVFWDWTFKKKIVCLTGVNMARRAFGDASFENRRRALDVVRRYIDEAFPKVREFHKMVARQVEQENAVRPLHGYCLVSYAATPEDQLKTAVAVWGQQTTAHLNKLAILDVQRRFKEGRPMRAILPVHDELVCYCKKEVPPQEAAAWLKESMEPVLPEMPGLNIPAEPSYGYTEPSNWRDTKRI